MNRHTFKDVGKRSALSNELDDDDEEHEGDVKELKRAVEGEEDEGESKFNEAGDVIEAFNLADEREGGHFDENMNYVFKKEKGEVDAWVAEMDEVAMEQAIGEAQRAVKRKAAEREEEERREAAKEFKTSIQLKKELLALMQPKETVASAMRRLSGKADKAPEKGAGIVRRRAPPAATPSEEKPSQITSAQQKLLDQKQARERRAQVDRATELSDELLTRGLTGVYSMSYESLKASTQTWEYQGQDGQLYGPYTAQQLAGWKAQGVFNSTWVRPVGENHAADNSTASASASAGVSSLRAVAPADSMYDDDIYSTEPAAPVAPAVVAPAEWVNSDEVDFGEYVNLDQAHQQLQQRTEQRKRQVLTSAEARAAAAAELRAERDGEGNGSGSALTRGATLGDEEDEEPEEAEGLSYRKRKNTGRRTQDIPDDSDEEN